MAPRKLLPCLFGLTVLAGVGPAAAQFGGWFNPSPRPPGTIPGGPQPSPSYPPPSPEYTLPPPDYRPAPPEGYQRPAPAPSAIQSQPLAAPLGTESSAPAAELRPGQIPQNTPQRQPGGPSLPPGAAPPSTDAVTSTLPTPKISNPTAVFSGLDKITGRTISFDVALGETVQFGTLRITPRACYTRPPTEAPNTDGFVEVDETTLQGEKKRIFTGWMYASSPGLHAVEHAIYDVWLVDCKQGAPGLVAGGSSAHASAQATGAPLRSADPSQEIKR